MGINDGLGTLDPTTIETAERIGGTVGRISVRPPKGSPRSGVTKVVDGIRRVEGLCYRPVSITWSRVRDLDETHRTHTWYRGSVPECVGDVSGTERPRVFRFRLAEGRARVGPFVNLYG